MIKKSLLAGLAVLALGSMTLASAKSWSGTVSDSKCGTKHAMAGDASASCVAKCVAGGGKYVLVSKGKVYQLEPQDKFADHAGHSVKVTGAMSGDTITASDVAMVSEHGSKRHGHGKKMKM